MSLRSRRILGLALQSQTSESKDAVSKRAETDVDEKILPEDISENNENMDPCERDFKMIENETRSNTINKTHSIITEKSKEKHRSRSLDDPSQKCHEEGFNDENPQLLTSVENVILVNKSPLDNELKINLVPDYDSDSYSYEDELQNAKEVEATKLQSRRMSSASTSSSSISSNSSASSSSASSSSSSSSDSDNSELRTDLTSEIIQHSTATELDQNATEDTSQSDCRSDTLTAIKTRIRTSCAMNSPVAISPIYTDVSDFDNDIDDPTFNFEGKFGNSSEHKKNFLLPSRSDSSSSDNGISNQTIKRRGRKRLKNPAKWKQNKTKRMRSEGKAYVSMSKTRKYMPSRCLKTPCTAKCRLKCTDKIDTQGRYEIFDKFWKLGDLEKQRAFINSCMVDVKPKYKYTNAETPRRPNKAFYLTLNNDKVRVCKTFFRSTLDISDRMINTIVTKTDEMGFISEDKRGKHGHHKTLDPDLIADIRKHIESIPRIESHYVRAQTTREYIDGSKTIKDLYKDFVESQTQNSKGGGNYHIYYRIFTTEFNLSFHRPKKDQCDLCVAYANLNGDQKEQIKEKYETHIKEKELSRMEKLIDRTNVSNNNKVVIYDLEAVLQCPRGDTSAFYYKSKLNCYNLTLTELRNKTEKHAYDNVHCYFWTESDAKRGAIEIGSCIWEYLKGVTCDETSGKDIIFYSDNCCGQNKNKFIATIYMYAVYLLNINSITHKFLVRGHTQNEADSVHSLIEKEVKRNLKSGPIYTPAQYITLIKSAKKSSPAVNVHEMPFDSFVDLKELQEDWGYNFNTNLNGQNVNWNDIKHLKMTKEDPFTFLYKTSYEDEEYKEVNVRNKRKKMKPPEDIILKQAYTQKQELSNNKKKGLKELITKGLISPYYANFFNSII